MGLAVLAYCIERGTAQYRSAGQKGRQRSAYDQAKRGAQQQGPGKMHLHGPVKGLWINPRDQNPTDGCAQHQSPQNGNCRAQG
ncbi:MAG: hypothetical protein RLZZ253_2784 [Verrucomicrobiota bacterium]